MKTHKRTTGGGPLCLCISKVVTTTEVDADVDCKSCLRWMTREKDLLLQILGPSAAKVRRKVEARVRGLATADDINWFGE